ncbi:hypothetical protein J6590_020944 [Homalodisca vitripennis]|nr:hypothetical protein J6590_020944 [Homalodisca vitripennis]
MAWASPLPRAVYLQPRAPDLVTVDTEVKCSCDPRTPDLAAVDTEVKCFCNVASGKLPTLPPPRVVYLQPRTPDLAAVDTEVKCFCSVASGNYQHYLHLA